MRQGGTDRAPWCRRLLLLAAGVALVASATVPLAAQNVRLDELAAAGKQAVAGGRFDEAQEIFAQGAQLAEEEGDAEWVLRMLFYQAYGYQKQGIAAGDDPELLERSVALYRGVLERQPTSGSTWVNLATVYGKLGMQDRATAAYERAIALDDDKRALYESKYAEFLAASGDTKSAAFYYQQVVAQKPQSSGAKKALLEVYLDPEMGEDPLLEHLWKLVDAGEVLSAEDAALRALEGGWPEATRRELLTLVVASLAKRFEDPKTLRASSTWERLGAFAGDSVIGEGVQELLEFYADPSRASFPWWSTPDRNRAEPSRGVRPADAFRQLLRRLGTWYEQQDRWESAESCYETAAVLVPGKVDPLAIRSLVNLYVRQGNIARVQAAADEYERPLFQGKGEAYRERDSSKIYLYHRTLGETYAYLAQGSGEWGDSQTVTSAVFQLERAKRFGEVLEAAGEGIYVDAELVELLAAAYDETNRPEDKRELVLGTAERYEARGDLKARDEVMRQLDPESLDRRDKKRYKKLRQEAVPVTRQDGAGSDSGG